MFSFSNDVLLRPICELHLDPEVGLWQTQNFWKSFGKVLHSHVMLDKRLNKTTLITISPQTHQQDLVFAVINFVVLA